MLQYFLSQVVPNSVLPFRAIRLTFWWRAVDVRTVSALAKTTAPAVPIQMQNRLSRRVRTTGTLPATTSAASLRLGSVTEKMTAWTTQMKNKTAQVCFLLKMEKTFYATIKTIF